VAAALVIALAALVGVWGERKVAGRIQMRIWPQELGPFG
jgi:NADH:ubiquinone oxidoreductase subunit H